MSKSRTERPITTRADDILNREPFIERLTTALVDPTNNIATGVVIGITGQWGSGKSSVLNLLAEHLIEKHPDAVVVRFDPWLVSGRSDLISQFIAELKSEIALKPKASEQLREFSKSLSRYGALLAPGANLIAPGIGTAIQGGFKAAESALNKSTSLSAERHKIVGHLQDVTTPIVVLIDELDRVEDDEIITVAQLVRAVLDFPKISYVLAYDVDRVVEALGRSSSERGRSYLEKIVSLQIPLPLQLREERVKLLRSELTALEIDAFSSEHDFQDNRYKEIEDILLRELIATPRDIKRVIGAFHALYGMVHRDVNVVDILGFAAISAKLPQTAERMKRHPERAVYNPVDRNEVRRRYGYGQSHFSSIVENLASENDTPESARDLLRSLFPFLQGPDHTNTTPAANTIAYRRPFLTLLRMGLIPGDVGEARAKTVLGLSRPDAEKAFVEHMTEDRLGSLLDRIESIYHEAYEGVSEGFWFGASDFVARRSADDWNASTIRTNTCGELRSVPFLSAGRESLSRKHLQSIAAALADAGDHRFAPGWIRAHFWRHNIFGYSSDRSSDDWFLTTGEVNKLAEHLGEALLARIDDGTLFPEMINLDAIQLLRSLKKWTPSHGSLLEEYCRTTDGLDHIAFMLFRGPDYADRNTIDNLGITGAIRKDTRSRIQMLDPEQVPLRQALQTMMRIAGG